MGDLKGHRSLENRENGKQDDLVSENEFVALASLEEGGDELHVVDELHDVRPIAQQQHATTVVDEAIQQVPAPADPQTNLSSGQSVHYEIGNDSTSQTGSSKLVQCSPAVSKKGHKRLISVINKDYNLRSKSGIASSPIHENTFTLRTNDGCDAMASMRAFTNRS